MPKRRHRGGGGVKKLKLPLPALFWGGPNTYKHVPKACHTTPSQASRARGERREERREARGEARGGRRGERRAPSHAGRASAVADLFIYIYIYIYINSYKTL